jgi:hypothetical protein
VETVSDVGLRGELLEDGRVWEAFAEPLMDGEEVSFEDFGTRGAGDRIESGASGLSEGPEGECFNGVRDRCRGTTDQRVIDVEGFADAPHDALEEGFAGTADRGGNECPQGFLDPATGGDVAGDAFDMGWGFSETDDAGRDLERTAVTGVVEHVDLERGFGLGFGESGLHAGPDALAVLRDDYVEHGTIAGLVGFDAEEPEGGLVEGEDATVLVEGVDEVDGAFDEEVVTLLEVGTVALVFPEGIVLAAESSDDDD